jgi:hypothetical protein
MVARILAFLLSSLAKKSDFSTTIFNFDSLTFLLHSDGGTGLIEMTIRFASA